jgi:tRNA (guanine37-N1)-methyltransferase
MSNPSITIVTLFPKLFDVFNDMTLIQKYFQLSQTNLDFVYLGDCSPKDFKGVDSPPYGGGAGMVIRPDVLKVALEKTFSKHFPDGDFDKDFQSNFEVVYTAPRGVIWNNEAARDFSKKLYKSEEDQSFKHIIFICGRYEGIDERFIQRYVDQVYSLGDYVLMGGELAVQIMLESSFRFIPGVLGHKDSADQDSFEQGDLEYPQYTRPAEFDGIKVPEVLTSGDHKKIQEFRKKAAFEMTLLHRPDLVKKEHHD